MHGGTIVDATIITAPGSTKNRAGRRDGEMHQTKKGNQWYFGMKVHSGVDAGSGYVHTITGTAANVHDVNETEKLIRDDDKLFTGIPGTLTPKNTCHLWRPNGSPLSTSGSTYAPRQSRCQRNMKAFDGTRRSRTANRPYVARLSIHFLLSNDNLVIVRRHTKASQKT